jgi:hypothetical protein
MKVAVRVFGSTLPSRVVGSFAGDAIADAGFTISLKTQGASAGPVAKIPAIMTPSGAIFDA